MKLKNRLIPFVTLLITILLYQSVFAASCCNNPQIKTTTSEVASGRFMSQVFYADNVTSCKKCNSGKLDMYENRWYIIYQVFETSFCSNCQDIKERNYTKNKYDYSDGYSLKCDSCGQYS